MFDEYLTKQNKFLTIISIAIAGLSVVHASILLLANHAILSLLEFCIAIALCASIRKIIYNNNRFIKKWNALSSIDQDAFFNLNDYNDLEKNIGNLNFDFKKPSD